MIAVDSSAIVAIVLREPERNAFLATIKKASKAFVSTASVMEAKMVVHGRRGQRAVVLVDELLKLPAFEIIPPDIVQMDAAYAAFVVFGKGNGHPANLNFGDLFSYALAKVHGLPLLFKGNDFGQTDIRPAVLTQHQSRRLTP